MKTMQYMTLIGLILAAAACGPKKVSRVGPGHDSNWPIEAPAASTYQNVFGQRQAESAGDLDAAIAEAQAGAQKDPKSAYFHLRLAMLYFQKRDIQNCEASLNRAISLDPKDLEALRFKARVHMAKGEGDKAEQVMRQVISLNEGDTSEDVLHLASLLVDQKKTPEAVSLLKDFISTHKNHVLAHYYLARVYAERNELDLALATHEQAVKINPTFSASYKAMGLIYEYQGQVSKAIGMYEKVLSLEPDNQEMLHHLAQIYIDEKKLESAYATYRRVLKESPKDPNALLKSGLIDMQLRRFSAAKKHFQNLLKVNPEVYTVHYYLGLIEEHDGHTDQALASYAKVDRESPLYVEAQLAMASVHLKNKQETKALSLLEAALEKSPNDLRVRLSAARLLAKAGRIDDAVKLLEVVLKEDAQQQDVLFTLAEVYEEAKDMTKIEQTLLRLLEVNPNHASAYNFLAYMYAERGVNLDKALTLVKKAMELKPNDGYFIDTLGWIYFQQKNYAEALKALEEANELNPQESVILDHLGDTYAALNQTKKALKSYEESLKYAEPTERSRIQEKIKRLRGAQRSGLIDQLDQRVCAHA